MSTRKWINLLISVVTGLSLLSPAGIRTGAAANVQDGRRVSGLSLLAAAAPYLSHELVISELDNVKYAPDIAFNSKHNEYLVVWENNWGAHHDIYAQRVSASGQLLSWFAVSANPPGPSQQEPSVAYDPSRDRYLVTWLLDAYGTGGDWDVYGRFIPWNGPNESLGDFVICNWTSNQAHPELAYGVSQDEFLVVWMNAVTPSYISGRRVFADGSGFPTNNGVTLSSGPENRDFPTVTYNLARNEYLVTWMVDKSETGLDIYGERLRGDGLPLTGGNPSVTGEFPIAGWPADEAYPSVAACDKADQYLVAWQSDQDTDGTDYAIYARYLNGDALPGGVYLVDDTTSPEVNPDVSCNQPGRQYLIAWQTRYVNLHYGVWARLAYPNESMDPAFGLVQSGASTDREYPSVAGGHANYLVAWEHGREGTGYKDIHGRLVAPYGLFLPLVIR